MMKIIKLLIPVIALVLGLAGGMFLKPSSDSEGQTDSEHGSQSHASEESGHDSEGLHDTPETHAADHANENSDKDAHAASDAHSEHSSESAVAWFNFSRQFFVPLVRHGDEAGIMILSIALETDTDNLQTLNDQEIRLRDIILRQLLIAANTGRFDGNFTTDGRIRGLRKQILAALQEVYGNKISAILISDIARQQE